MAAENMYCSSQKASSKEFRDNFDSIFGKKEDVELVPSGTLTAEAVSAIDEYFKGWREYSEI